MWKVLKLFKLKIKASSYSKLQCVWPTEAVAGEYRVDSRSEFCANALTSALWNVKAPPATTLTGFLKLERLTSVFHPHRVLNLVFVTCAVLASLLSQVS